LHAHIEHDRGAFLTLLAMMSGSANDSFIDYARQKMLHDPGIARERHRYGRTLLHDATGAGSITIVKLLLELGADPNALDEGAHAPLYCVGNECYAETGGEVVHALVTSGADVNACNGVKRCTALHMAARRGNVPVAEALLDCGADLEAQDKAGVTPLHRADNCRKADMASSMVAPAPRCSQANLESCVECLPRPRQWDQIPRLQNRRNCCCFIRALTLETFPYSRQPGVNRKQIRAFAELDFIAKHENLVLAGPTGAGHFRRVLQGHFCQAPKHYPCPR
jgi:ankyrin repeat protein